MHFIRLDVRKAVVAVLTLAACCVMLLAHAGSSRAATDEATAEQLDAAHTGAQSSPITAPLSSAWHVTESGQKISTPLIVNGIVYFSTSDEVYAVQQSDGDQLWDKPMSTTYGFLGLAYDAGQLFVLNESGTLEALNATTGAEDWTTSLSGQYEFLNAPVATNGYVYVNGAGDAGTVYAVSQATGETVWTGQDESGDGSPAVTSTGAYITEVCNDAYDFEPFTGVLQWSTSSSCDGGGGTNPVVVGDSLFDASAGLIRDAGTGSSLGTFTTGPLAVGDQLAISEDEGSLTAVSDSGLGTGSWNFAGDGNLSTSPLVVGNLVFEGSSNGNLYAVNTSDGSAAWSTNLGLSDPADYTATSLSSGENTLLVPTTGELFAFTGANTGSTSSVPSLMTTPSVADSPYVGMGAGADVGVWSGLPSSYRYQWELCDANGADCSDIAGAQSESYTPTSDQVGDTLEVSVTASNGAGSSNTSTSAPSAAIATEPAVPTHGSGSGAGSGGSGNGSISGNTDVPVTVTITLAGAGTGTVTSTPAGIDCGGGATACSYTFTAAQYDAGIEVLGTPAAGSGGEGFQVNGDCYEVNTSSCQATAIFGGPPSATISSPADAATYTTASLPAANFSCTAGANAILAVCTASLDGGAPVPSGAALPSGLGQHTMVVTAQDSDGNGVQYSFHYDVVATTGDVTPPPATPVYGTMTKAATKGSRAQLTLSCPAGTGGCTALITLTAKVRTKVKRHGRTRTVTKVETVGTAIAQLAAGAQSLESVSLNRTGAALLKRSHHLTTTIDTVFTSSSFAGTTRKITGTASFTVAKTTKHTKTARRRRKAAHTH